MIVSHGEESAINLNSDKEVNINVGTKNSDGDFKGLQVKITKTGITLNDSNNDTISSVTLTVDTIASLMALLSLSPAVAPIVTPEDE